jgi:predicted TIM-barrel fold metal-dependent hydrolase
MAQRYELDIDVDKLVAIDTHVHIEMDGHGHHALPQHILDGMSSYFKTDSHRPTLDETAELYRSQSMAAVVFTVDCTTAMGHVPNSQEDIIAGAIRNSDVLIPFGSVDPLQGPQALDRAKELFEDYGVRGFKFHPTAQGWDPSDSTFFPLFELIEQMEVPIVVHTGQTGVGAGLPGGAGLRLSLSNPMLLDDLAAAFPALNIVMAHPSVPWQDEALAVATHKTNTWIDLSGWSPKYFPENLVRQANSILQNKVLFATDFPMLTPERWIRDFDTLTIKDEVRPKILKGNAIRLLGLDK